MPADLFPGPFLARKRVGHGDSSVERMYQRLPAPDLDSTGRKEPHRGSTYTGG